MKIQRFLIVLTVVNLGLLMFLLAQIRPVEAQTVGQVLRGRTLELVDEHGKVRASIKVEPAGRMPNGQTYPETVILRLIDPNGQPSVKLGTSEQGAGLSLVGGDDASYVVLKTDVKEGSLKLTNKDGRQRLIQP